MIALSHNMHTFLSFLYICDDDDDMHISFPHPKYLLNILCFFLFLNKKITLISPTLLSVLLNVISKNISNAIQSSAHASVTTLDKCNNLNTNSSNCRYFRILYPNNAIVTILPHNIDNSDDIFSFNLFPVLKCWKINFTSSSNHRSILINIYHKK